MTVARLADVAWINPRPTIRPSLKEIVSFVPMAELDATTSATSEGEDRPFEEVQKGYTVFSDGDLLVAKITPCFQNKKIGQAQLRHPVGVGSTEFHVIRPFIDRLDARYALHFLRQSRVLLDGERRMTGSGGQRRVPAAYLAELELPLPPVEKQRRIAAILDQAEALCTKRRQALAHLDDLTQSIFLDMFGDPVTNPREWDEVRLVDLLSAPLRNGVSPSSRGTVSACVLTLSAVTGSGFRGESAKEGAFTSSPSQSQRVCKADLLICRGNGNLGLVGRGFFPSTDMPETVFPDTMIAARVAADRVLPDFLERQWNSTAVRRQIESVARTTNGTFKVNQTMLAEIRLLSPPERLQREFARRVSELGSARRCHTVQATQLDCLFASLQDRSFSGRL